MSHKGWVLVTTAAVVAVSAAALTLTAQTPARRALSPAPEFIPDWTFSGSALPPWQRLGNATWTAENGVIVGTPTEAAGGWLLSDKSYQDVQFFTRFRCDGPCNAGVLFRVEKTTDGGIRGMFVSLKEGDLNVYRLTLDAQGREVSRELIPDVTYGTGRTPMVPAAAAAGGRGAAPAAGAAGAARGGGGGGGGRATGPGGRPLGPTFLPAAPLPTPLPELAMPEYGLGKQPNGEWDRINIIYDTTLLRPELNNTNEMPPSIIGELDTYGPIALYVGGTGAVRFRDVSIKDLFVRTIPLEQVSSRFRMQQLEEFTYGWGAASADFNRDGRPDITVGPYIYDGPDFTKRHEVYLGTITTTNMVSHAADITGDGWPDILATENRPLVLYVNPGSHNRRWQRVAPAVPINGETSVMRDVDGDGRVDVVGTIQNAMAYATYDPARPTAPWTVHRVSEATIGYGHSGGVGDVNGDKRPDILGYGGMVGAAGDHHTGHVLEYHPVAFGRYGRSQSAGGGEIEVFDINGDGLNDVMTGLHGHGFGLAWFEQRRSPAGEITFVRHSIMGDFSTENAGGVTFSQLHGSIAADMDGDGVKDFITGKRYWSHGDGNFDPDGYGEAVVYVYRTVRDRAAPGGARFVPELVHNRSGVGSQILAADLNADGRVDIVNAARQGTYIFWNNWRR